MSELPPTLENLLAEFLALSEEKPTDTDVSRLRRIFDLIICKKWGSDYVVNAPVQYTLWEQDKHQEFKYKPVPKTAMGIFGENLNIGSNEFDEFVRAISDNHEQSEADVTEFLRIMRIKSGRELQTRDWDKRRLESAVKDIRKEKDGRASTNNN